MTPPVLEPITLAAPQPGVLAVLGSTGSVGTQTLDLVRRNPGLFRVAALAVKSSGEQVVAQAREFKPRLVAVTDEEAGRNVRTALTGQCDVVIGEEAATEAAACSEAHTVVAAMVGFASLKPVVAAIEAGKHIALANKEVLVAAGPLIKNLLAKSSSFIAPLDSEHNALFQCLLGRGMTGVRRIIITASGGPFRNDSLERLAEVRPDEAIRHPRWDMGPKISIDSASLMNKGLEVVEAAMLFNLAPDQIEVLIHPQSVLHGIVEYSEGSALAVMYEPDMRVPIAFALSFLRSEDPHCSPGNFVAHSGSRFLDLAATQKLEFYPPDLVRFPGLKLCYQALEQGGTMPAILNAANEVAVQAFVDGSIGFLEMAKVVAETMRRHDAQVAETLAVVIDADASARAIASNIVDTLGSADLAEATQFMTGEGQ